MPDTSFLSWPFFDERHRDFTSRLKDFTRDLHVSHDDVDAACRTLVRHLGEAGWLRAVAPAAYGGEGETFDVRTLCLARETLAYHDGLADFAFAMQGLGTGPVTLFGSEALKRRVLPGVVAGTRIAAFALSEPEAGSDVAALATTARIEGGEAILDGEKT